MFFPHNGREYFGLVQPSPELVYLTEAPSNLHITQALLNAMLEREVELRAHCGEDCALRVAAEFGFEDQQAGASLLRQLRSSLLKKQVVEL